MLTIRALTRLKLGMVRLYNSTELLSKMASGNGVKSPTFLDAPSPIVAGGDSNQATKLNQFKELSPASPMKLFCFDDMRTSSVRGQPYTLGRSPWRSAIH